MPIERFFSILGVALLSAGITAWALPKVARHARRTGHVDRPGGRKTQTAAVPYAAPGLAAGFWFSVLLSLGLAFLLTRSWFPTSVFRELLPDAEGAVRRAPALLWILGGSLVMALMGRIDDSRGLPVAPRFVVQVAVAILVALFGVRATLFVESTLIQVAISALWIVFVTNAMNFIDNMDGLCCGCGLATTLGITTIAGQDGQFLVTALAAALAGALGVFLVFNRPKAELYLGDEGSQFLGFLLACLALCVSFRSESEPVADFAWAPLLAPAFLLILPLADGAVVIASRIRRGVTPWTPGLDHLSHRLAAAVGKESAVGWLVCVAFIAGAAAILVSAPSGRGGAAILIVCGVLTAAAIASGRKTGEGRDTAP